MKIERTKNSIQGMTSGIVNKIVSLLLPFIVRTIFINTLGIQYLGLNSLFASILNILNLAELGVGSAISFSLYDAIAKEENNKICALINLYKKIYKVIGIFILVIGLLLLPFLHIICNSDVPNNINIYIVYILYLINSSISYLFYAYKNSLFASHQKNYITNNINTLINVLLNITQACALIIFRNYYVYVILLISSTLLNNILVCYYANKIYPQYQPHGEISYLEKKSIYSKVKALFYYKVGAVVLASIDSIVINYYLGLSVLGKYNSYYYIITTLFGFIQIITNSMLAGVGNSIITDTVEKNKKDFDRINFIMSWIIGFCSICLLCLYQPFMHLWLGKENMFPIGLVIMLSAYFYVWKMMEIVNMYKDANGLWERDKFRPLVASAVNLILNILLVQVIGIYGIVISTIISILLVIFPWSSYILFKEYFKKGYIGYVLNYLKYLLVTVINGSLTYFICSFFVTYTLNGLIIGCTICIFIPNIIYFLIYARSTLFNNSIIWVLDKFSFKRIKSLYDKIIKRITRVYIVVIIILILFGLCIGLNHYMNLYKFKNIEYVNFSIDDTIEVFYDLYINESKYKSIFDNELLLYLKKLHNQYGAKFTLYIFNQKKDFDISQMSSNYKDEFIKNSNWLKFGFHGYNQNSDYSQQPIQNDFQNTMSILEKIVGTECINYTIRLPFFKAKLEYINNISYKDNRINRFLGADNINRDDYYLNTEQNLELFQKDILYDEKNDFVFYNTDFRIENFSYNTWNLDIYQDNTLIIFTHENKINNINKKKIDYIFYLLNRHKSEYIFLDE